MKKNLLHFLLFCAVFTLANRSGAQPVISFQSIITGLTQPLDIVNAKDGSGRLFIVEKAGTIRIWTGSTLLPAPFLNISSAIRSTGSEQGLLSVAFHPNYATNGFFYVWYNNTSGNVTLARYSRSTLNTADPASGVVLLTIFKPFANHNGAKLNFGRDGYLYFGTGDGGSAGDPANRAQNGDSLQGKMIRIDVNNPNPPYYSIPPTNPYTTNPAIRDEIIALGLRNPWRWSFDRQTGDMWIADVGQNLYEEVNFVAAADITDKNYGWRCFEGSQVFNSSCGAQPNNVVPVFEYPHDNTTGGYSITGGYVYRGTEFPALQGYYLTSDYVSNHGWLIRRGLTGTFQSTMQASWAAGISAYGEGEDSVLYAVSLSGGIVYKVIASGTLPVKLLSFNGRINNGAHELGWNVADEEVGSRYIIEKRTDQTLPFDEAFGFSATANRSSNAYTKALPGNQSAFYRLKMITSAGQTVYSQTVYLKGAAGKNGIRATISGTQLMVNIPLDARSISVSDASGRLLYRETYKGQTGYTTIPLSKIQRGALIVNVVFDGRTEYVKVVY